MTNRIKYKNNITIDNTFNYGNAKNINYGGIAIENNNLDNAFANNKTVTSISNINTNVTRMVSTFENCVTLTSFDKVPDNIVNMHSTFRNCHVMTTTPDMSNAINIDNMQYAFYYCNSMVNAPDLSNCYKLNNMHRTFAYCYELKETPFIPNSVTIMANICQGCTNITSLPNIPPSVTDISYSFDQCRNITSCNVNIPSQITNMAYTFSRCSGLKGKIFIESENITNATNCFATTSSNKDVYIPFKYENGTTTTTYNSFITAGYDELGTSEGVTLLDLKSYVPPIHYDFDDSKGELKTFTWNIDLSTSYEEIAGITTVTIPGVQYGDNMYYKDSTISDRNAIGHTTNNEQAPGEESYIGFLFTTTGGMFKPTSLNFKTSKNGTSGGSVMVAMKFDSSDEVIIGTYPTIARNSETPSYTEDTIDLTSFDMGATKGTAIIKFYLYNQGSTKTFSVYDVSIVGRLQIEE